MKSTKALVLIVLVLAPLATSQLAVAAAAAAEAGKKPEWLLPIIPRLVLPEPFWEIVQCMTSLAVYATELFGFVERGDGLSDLACDAIRALPAACQDGLHHLLNMPPGHCKALKRLCGVPHAHPHP